MDDCWFCIKRIESGRPGKIYFEGMLTAQSSAQEAPGGALGKFALRLQGVAASDEGAGAEGGRAEEGNLGQEVEVGFDSAEDVAMWLKVLCEQIALASDEA